MSSHMVFKTCWMQLLACTLQGVVSLHVEISPTLMHVRTTRGRVTITCTADAPLSTCHFKWREMSGAEGPLLIGSLGSGFRCTQSFDLDESFKLRVVGCRVREDHGGWRYATMTLHHAQGREPVAMTAPRSVTVLPGEDASILCSADRPLASCSFMLPALGHVSVSESAAAAPGYRYLGSGLGNGQCGVTLEDVTEDNSGWVWCSVQTETSGLEQQAIPLVVARRLQAPTLRTNGDSFTEGSTLEATCRVLDTRPAASMTWYLGERIVRQGDDDDAPSSAWRWPVDSQQLTQKLTLQLGWQDHGKQLACEVSHSGLLSSKISTNKTLQVEYMPRVIANIIPSYWFEVGKSAVATLQLFANPRPNVNWVRADGLTGTEIEEGDSDQTGRLEAAILEQQGPSSWLAKLYFNNLSWADMQLSHNIFLRARNHLGDRHFKLLNLEESPPAHVQGSPTLTSRFDENTGVLQASCQIRNTRRVGRFRWHLGPHKMDDGFTASQVAHTDSQGVHTIVQNFTRKTTWADDGKNLTCWAAGAADSIHVVIRHAPHLLVGRSIGTTQTLTLREPGILSIYWSANPRPVVEWWVDNLGIENDTDSQRPIKEAETLHEDGSIWVTQLVLKNLSDENMTGFTLHIRASNELGSSETYIKNITLEDSQTTGSDWQSTSVPTSYLNDVRTTDFPVSLSTLSDITHSVPATILEMEAKPAVYQGAAVNMYLLVFSILSAVLILVSGTAIICTCAALRPSGNVNFAPSSPGSFSRDDCGILLASAHKAHETCGSDSKQGRQMANSWISDTESFPNPPPDTTELTSLARTEPHLFPPPPTDNNQGRQMTSFWTSDTESFPNPPPDTTELTSLALTDPQLFSPPPADNNQDRQMTSSWTSDTESFPNPPDITELTSLSITDPQLFPPPPADWKLRPIPDVEGFPLPPFDDDTGPVDVYHLTSPCLAPNMWTQ